MAKRQLPRDQGLEPAAMSHKNGLSELRRFVRQNKSLIFVVASGVGVALVTLIKPEMPGGYAQLVGVFVAVFLISFLFWGIRRLSSTQLQKKLDDQNRQLQHLRSQSEEANARARRAQEQLEEQRDRLSQCALDELCDGLWTPDVAAPARQIIGQYLEHQWGHLKDMKDGVYVYRKDYLDLLLIPSVKRSVRIVATSCSSVRPLLDLAYEDKDRHIARGLIARRFGDYFDVQVDRFKDLDRQAKHLAVYRFFAFDKGTFDKERKFDEASGEVRDLWKEMVLKHRTEGFRIAYCDPTELDLGSKGEVRQITAFWDEQGRSWGFEVIDEDALAYSIKLAFLPASWLRSRFSQIRGELKRRSKEWDFSVDEKTGGVTVFGRDGKAFPDLGP